VSIKTVSRSAADGLLLLFDGNALVHRAFHALPPLTQPKTGEMVNAVYGFASTLLKVLADLQPTHWAVAFDRPTPTFRHELFADYKAQRPAAPEELKSQMAKVRQVVEAFHIPVYELDGYEADDVLGTLSKQAAGEGIETVIVTGDNDMLQTVMPRVKALAPRRGFSDTVLYDEEAVEQKCGVRPGQVADLKALAGDASDNIPGVPGVGAKTASRLLQHYGTLDGIYDHIDDVTPARLQKLLGEARSEAFRSRELATIVRDLPIELDLKACQLTHYDRNEVVKLFQGFEFTNLLSRLPRATGIAGGAAESEPATSGTCHVVDSGTVLDQLVRELGSAREAVVRVEATGKNGITADLVGMTISSAPGRAFYVPLGHRGFDQPGQLSVATVTQELGSVLGAGRVNVTAFDAKRVAEILACCDMQVADFQFDPMIAGYLLGEKNLTLRSLAFNRLGVEISLPGEADGAGPKQASLAMLDARELADRSCRVADLSWALKDVLERELRQNDLWQLFAEVEMPLIPVLVDMERNGVALDIGMLRGMSLALGDELQSLERDIYAGVGHQFNINSPQQLGRVLFEELGLPQSRKTKSGYSTDASVLEGLRGAHPVIELVLQYRQISKLKSTYVDALPAMVNRETGRPHTSFNQTGTATGRLSSSEPNLQNIPVRGELGTKVRTAIIAAAGCYLFSADYSQIDLRALAHLSEDPGLLAAFAQDEDIHSTTAARLFNVPLSGVTPAMRRAAKTVNFGVVYGMSGYGLEQATDLSREEASQFIALYFEKYPRVKEYLEFTKEQARQHGYVRTVMGRRRFIPEVNSPNRLLREAAERMAINAPVQGTSADIIKLAMIELHREMKRRKLASKMLLQIHDELLFEVPEAELGEIKSLVAEIMPTAIRLRVPLRIDVKLGRNWGEMA